MDELNSWPGPPTGAAGSISVSNSLCGSLEAAFDVSDRTQNMILGSSAHLLFIYRLGSQSFGEKWVGKWELSYAMLHTSNGVLEK